MVAGHIPMGVTLQSKISENHLRGSGFAVETKEVGPQRSYS